MTRMIVSKHKVGKESPYDSILGNFRNDLNVLKELNNKLADSVENMRKESLRVVKEKVRSLDAEAQEELAEFVAGLKTPLPKNKKVVLEGKPAEIFWELTNEGFLVPNRFLMFIRDMGLVYLIAQYENFLRHTLEVTFSEKPEILSTCKKSVTFEQLMKFESLDSVKEEIIGKEASEVTNQDVEEINDYFQNKLNINISECDEWEKFKERFCRRNVLIHNSGMPNEHYRKKTGYTGKNERLTVNKEYLDESIVMFENMASKLARDLKRKFKTHSPHKQKSYVGSRKQRSKTPMPMSSET